MLKVANISMRYHRAEKSVFSDVSFELNSSEIMPLIGGNGSGKTTLLRILAGIIRPEKGSACINGVDILSRTIEAQRSIGISLYPERSFYYRLTGRQNIEYFASLKGIFGKEAKREANRVLSELGLEDKADSMFMRMSLGQRRRLGVSRAILGSPSLLLLDEPTSNLDASGTFLVQDVISRHASAGGSVIISTHHQQDLRLSTKAVLALKNGRCELLLSNKSILSRKIEFSFESKNSSAIHKLSEKYPITLSSDGALVDVPVEISLAQIVEEISGLGICISSVKDTMWFPERNS
ncbi:heme ABC exporter ATP-binding protein CcmA [Austwickia chelonae]|uniref:heme ABC exporter ATP-binding protein CcmA n=1 Tax=Austwickia chelonae TaxID=100225 RepID=UPI000E231F6C|nr:heme ABC exporter ATP-binding protein CcmA [Austwickia chelonae]